MAEQELKCPKCDCVFCPFEGEYEDDDLVVCQECYAIFPLRDYIPVVGSPFVAVGVESFETMMIWPWEAFQPRMGGPKLFSTMFDMDGVAASFLGEDEKWYSMIILGSLGNHHWAWHCGMMSLGILSIDPVTMSDNWNEGDENAS